MALLMQSLFWQWIYVKGTEIHFWNLMILRKTSFTLLDTILEYDSLIILFVFLCMLFVFLCNVRDISKRDTYESKCNYSEKEYVTL